MVLGQLGLCIFPSWFLLFYFRKRFFCRFCGGGNFHLAVGTADKTSLIGRRRQVYTRLEHGVKEFLKGVYVAFADLRQIFRRRWTEIKPPHAADASRTKRHTGLIRRRRQRGGYGFAVWFNLSKNPSDSTIFNVAKPAANATGLPDRVPA